MIRTAASLILSIFTALGVGLTATAAYASAPTDKAFKTIENMKAVVIYFTHSGNTEIAAKEVAAATGARMVRLMPAQPYSSADVDWENEQSRCTQEHLNQSLRPAIKPVDVNFDELNTVFIGFPIWWYEEPAVIRTFLDQYRDPLKDKVLYPFCTSYESPMSEADATLRKGYPDLNWKIGLRLPASQAEIKKWIEQ